MAERECYGSDQEGGLAELRRRAMDGASEEARGARFSSEFLLPTWVVW